MSRGQDKRVEKKFTHDSLGALSIEQLIDIVLLQQAQIEGLMSQASRVAVLETQLEELTRGLGTNFQNSSKSPSSDGPGVGDAKGKGGGGSDAEHESHFV